MIEAEYHAHEEAEFLDRVGDPAMCVKQVPDDTEWRNWMELQYRIYQEVDNGSE